MDTPKLQPITNKLKNNSGNASNETNTNAEAAGTSHGVNSRFNNNGIGYGSIGNGNEPSNHQFASGDRRYNFVGSGRRDFIAERRRDQYPNRTESYHRAKYDYSQRSDQTSYYTWNQNRYNNGPNRNSNHWSNEYRKEYNFWHNEPPRRNSPYSSNESDRKPVNFQRKDNTAGTIGIEKKAETTSNVNNKINEIISTSTKIRDKGLEISYLISTESDKKNAENSNSTQNNNKVKNPKKTLLNKTQPKVKSPNIKKINKNNPKISPKNIRKKQLPKTRCENTNKILNYSNLSKCDDKLVPEPSNKDTEKSNEHNLTSENLSNEEKNPTLDSKEQSKNIESCIEEICRNSNTNIFLNQTSDYGEKQRCENIKESSLEKRDLNEKGNIDINIQVINKDPVTHTQSTFESAISKSSSKENIADTEILIQLSRSIDDKFVDNNNENISNVQTINCVNINSDEEEITILLTTDIPNVCDVDANGSDISECREFTEEETTNHNCITSTINDTNNKPRISIVPLSRLIRNELIESSTTDDSSVTETENTPTTPTLPAGTPSKRICRPNLVKRRRKISTCSNSSGTTENLIEKVAGMDKFGIKEVINNSGTRFDEALKAHARKRLREEIRKQLKSMNLETAKDVDNVDFVPDDIVDAICIPDVLLEEIRKAFGIEIFYNNDLSMLQQAAMSIVAPADTEKTSEAQMDEIAKNVGENVLNIPATNNSAPLQESLVETTTTTVVGTETEVDKEKNVVEKDKMVEKQKELKEGDKTLEIKEVGKAKKVVNAKNVVKAKNVVEKDKPVEKQKELKETDKRSQVKESEKVSQVKESEKVSQVKEIDKGSQVKEGDKSNNLMGKNETVGKQKELKDNHKTPQVKEVVKTKNVAKAKNVTDKDKTVEKQKELEESGKTAEVKELDKTKNFVGKDETLKNGEQTKKSEKTAEVNNNSTSPKVAQNINVSKERNKENINERNSETIKENVKERNSEKIKENIKEEYSESCKENMRGKNSEKHRTPKAKKSRRKKIDSDVILLDTSSSSSSASSSSSSSDSDTESELSSKSNTSSVKRRRIKLRIDAQNVVESFEKLILPSLSENLKTRYHNKFSNSTYTRLHFISCICTSEYNSRKFTKNEIAKIQSDLKSGDRTAALEFLMREIVSVFNKQKDAAKKRRGSCNKTRINTTESTEKPQSSDEQQSLGTANMSVASKKDEAAGNTLGTAEKANGISTQAIKDASNNSNSSSNKKSANAAEKVDVEKNCSMQSKTTPTSSTSPSPSPKQQHQSVNGQTLMSRNLEVGEEESEGKNAGNAKTTDEIIGGEMHKTVVNAHAELNNNLQQSNNNNNCTNQETTNVNMLANETTRQHLATTTTSTENNETVNEQQRDRDETASISVNTRGAPLNELNIGAETLPFSPRSYTKELFGAADSKLNGTAANTSMRTENGMFNSMWGLSSMSPLVSNTLFPTVDLESLRQKNILGEFVVNNLRELDFKLMELHKRKMFVEEMILKLQRDKMDMDMQTMQLQNEKFLLLNTAMTAAASELPKRETTNTSATRISPARMSTPNSDATQPQTATTTSNTPPSTGTTSRAMQTIRPDCLKRKNSNNISTNAKRKRGPRGKRGGACRKVAAKRGKNAQEKDQHSSIITFEPDKLLSPGRAAQRHTPSPNRSNSDRSFNDNDRSLSSSDLHVGTIDVRSALTQVNLYEQWIIAAGEDGRLYKFSAKTLKLEMQFAKHNEAITHSYLCREKKVLYTTSLDGYMKKTSLENFALDIQSVYMQEPLQCIEVQWGVAFIGSRWGNIFTYDVVSNLFSNSVNSASDTPITAIKATKEGPRRILIVASKSKDLQIRDASSYLLLRTISLPDSLSAYNLLLDDGCIYCGTQRRDIVKFDFITGELLCTISCGIGASVMRQYQKKYLLIGSYDGYVYVIDKAKGRQWGRYTDCGGNILTLTVINNKIITTSKDKTLRINELPHNFDTKRK